MRVLVTGSRSWSDIHTIRKRLLRLPPDTVIVHGAAPGADTIAAWLAGDFGFETDAYPVTPSDWRRLGNAAGILRNRTMLDSEPELVLAFWDGRSTGTKDCIEEALKRGIRVEIIQGMPPGSDAA